MSESFKLHKNGQWSFEPLEKAVSAGKPRPIVGVRREDHSGAAFTTEAGDDAPVRSKKYQGGDPRHYNQALVNDKRHFSSGEHKTRSAKDRTQVAYGEENAKPRAFTTGRSKLRFQDTKKGETCTLAKNGQWSLSKDQSAASGGDESHVTAHLPAHVTQLNNKKPGTPEYHKYVDAAHEWHNKVHQAVMKDNPHLKHSFGENLNPRTHGYEGHLKSTKELDKLHQKHGAHYTVSHHEAHEEEK